MSSYYRQQLEDWLKTIDVKAEKVLDIGGSANPVKGRTKSWEVGEYKILDNNAEKGYHKKWVDTHFYGDINKDSAFFVRFDADIVFCLEVFEYVYNPINAIKYIYYRTRDVAYLSFPSIYPVHNPKNIDYMRYTKAGVQKLLNEAGFADWEITPRKATKGRNALASFYSLEGMRAVKNDDVIFDIGYMVKAVR